jgi:3-methyladenine DNA glycosylase AlkC
MAEALKFMYNPAFFEGLCPVLSKHIPGFDCKQFIFRVFDNSWPDLELKARVRKISLVLHAFMPPEFTVASKILTNISYALRSSELKHNTFSTIFLPDYVEVFGLDYPAESLIALEEITKLVSAEFAVRPFIIRYPETTMKHMYEWSLSSDPNVRRLSSEGCRPRLPWAMGLPSFKKDPAIIFPILENLKTDPSEFVRRSVANNLNDIGKDHPDAVLKICRRWKGVHRHTDWILRHGCRGLLKKGNTKALELHGFDPNKRSAVRSLKLKQQKVRVGGDLTFDFEFASLENNVSRYRLEYAIDYITSSGKTSRKIFKIAEKKLQPGGRLVIERRQSFKDLTTRKHHKGKHVLSILANGKKMAATEFLVC